jgi:hypothetical protein
MRCLVVVLVLAVGVGAWSGEAALAHQDGGLVFQPMPFQRFDHDKTGFPLRGAHVRACADCHQPSGKSRFTPTPNTCLGCHATVHQPKKFTNAQCSQCHVGL